MDNKRQRNVSDNYINFELIMKYNIQIDFK